MPGSTHAHASSAVPAFALRTAPQRWVHLTPLLAAAACRLMAAADHPNLLTFHEAFVERAQLFVITELAPGGDLGALLG